MKQQLPTVSFSKNRVFITLFLHVVIGAMSSFAPEENVGTWMKINILLALILGLTNYILWINHKNDSKRYFSLHSFVMMLGVAFYMMAPAFRSLYPSMFFWILLVVTIGFLVFLLLKRDDITRALVNPQDAWFKKIVFGYCGVIFITGSTLWAYMLATQTGPFMPVAIMLFFIGIFLMMVSPAMLSTPKRVRELEQL
ncbi:hypothetical protein LG296_04950 [Ureibacillus chungkukjangi]|uniref:hypothetical protein n=1 Tax=Ureibacillus chungkukjangi TaxID=1202712 RepID=UPI00384E04E6